MKFREIDAALEQMKKLLVHRGSQDRVPGRERVQSQIPGALKHSYDWTVFAEKLFMRLPGMSLDDLIRENTYLPWALPWLAGDVRCYYQRYYAWLLLDALRDALDWYRRHGTWTVTCDMEEFYELVRFSSEGGWIISRLSDMEDRCYQSLSAASRMFESKRFDGQNRTPKTDEAIRQAFTEALSGNHDADENPWMTHPTNPPA
jgi:CubicO group peptidase (beta-lactamase class C family)